MPFEMTQARAHLRRYMREIKDSLTTEEDIARYQQFNKKLKTLSDRTDWLYSGPIPMVKDFRNMLRKDYEDVLTAAGEILAEQNTGPVGQRIQSVVRELTPLLTADLHALDLVERDPDLHLMTAGELFGSVKIQTADLGTAAGPVGDQPMPLRVSGPEREEAGVFTPVRSGEAGRQISAFSRLAGLLGEAELATKARPMLLFHAGGSTAGEFVSRTDGMDPANVKTGDPLLSFRAENLDTVPARSGLASMQLLDFLCGRPPRGPEGCFLRFNPPYGPNARLVGLTVRPDGARFSTEPVDPDRLAGLGVIPEALYTMLSDPAFPNQVKFALRDYNLPKEAIDRILERRDALIEKVEADRAYFADKAPGYTEPGRLRLVPENQWGSCSLVNLAQAAPDSPFAALLELPRKAAERLQAQPQAEDAPREVVPTARITGNALRQEPDPLNLNRPETIRLHIPKLSEDSAMKGGQNSRYPVQWTENGRLRQGMFTLPKVNSRKALEKELLAGCLRDPQFEAYRDVFLAIRDYYSDPEQGRGLSELPSTAARLPWKEMGLSRERFDQIKGQIVLDLTFADIGRKLDQQSRILANEERIGHSRGERVDLRNVAMSDIADVLGFPKLLARSTTAQVELDGQLVDGIFMEAAEGEDFKKAVPGTAMASITAEQAKTVFNTEGLKDLADIQILDYICLNRDRHHCNMFYRFEGLETGNPRFLGIQGIDNDLAFGTEVPEDGSPTSHLAALKDIKVVSASMAQSLRNPQLMDGIAAKMRKNGLPEQEIEAARRRLEKLRGRLQKGKLKVVENGQWGKGKYTLENLSKGDGNSSIFHLFQEKVVDTLARRAKQHPVQPGQYLRPEKPKYQNVQRVERFGETALQAAEQEALEEKASAKLAEYAMEAGKTAAQGENPEHNALFVMVKNTQKALEKLEAGSLPWPWGSSRYREMHEACRSLQEYAQKLADKLREDPRLEISEEESTALQQKLNTLADRSAAYTSYKTRDLEHHAAGSSTAQRQSAAALCGELSAGTADVLKQIRKDRQAPMQFVHEKLRSTQAALSGKTGALLREMTANVLYLNAVTRMDLSQKKGGGSVYRALGEDAVRRQTARILQEPAFQRLAALPDDELRALAAGEGGRALANRFMREYAREQNAQIPQQEIPDAVQRQEQPNRHIEQGGLQAQH